MLFFILVSKEEEGEYKLLNEILRNATQYRCFRLTVAIWVSLSYTHFFLCIVVFLCIEKKNIPSAFQQHSYTNKCYLFIAVTRTRIITETLYSKRMCCCILNLRRWCLWCIVGYFDVVYNNKKIGSLLTGRLRCLLLHTESVRWVKWQIKWFLLMN